MGTRLQGRRVVLTGISRGVGFETAKRFLEEGARVFGVARDGARLARAAQALAPLGECETMQLDIAAEGAPEQLADAVGRRWGAVDVLFHDAAILVGGAASFEGEPPGTFERTLDVNLIAPFRITMALLPLLRRGREPRIVNVGSGAGTFEGVRLAGIASYRLSKWALHGLTLLLATQLAGEVSVNAFDPGWVKTDLGGPNAPGDARDSAEGALAVVTLPAATTGKLWKDGREIPF